MTNIPAHFKIEMRPQANKSAVVQVGKARFSWLTPRIIRMEYSETGQFEERASQAFWHRDQPRVAYQKHVSEEGVAVLENEYLRLVYKGGAFSLDTLSVEVKVLGITWHYGDLAAGNLGGTGRTVDGARGPIPIETGLISKDGWSLVDDSASLVFNQDCWLVPRNAPEGNLDLYFLGFSHDYLGCLKEYSQVTGSVAMIPRWVLGNWWSRYWEYTQDTLTALMEDFKAHEVPLSVCIIDMDWHITKTGNTSSGWTGYTWNRELFPNPQAQLDWLHQQGLRVTMNLHPADGIHPHEEQYPEMARRMGVDPESKKPVEFDIANPEFANAYFDVLHHPQEEQGVDFWWMDWQQGTRSKIQGLDPLWWLNHLHFYDLGRGGKKRSFIFSRWGGLGNHRYPIGFSGDSVVCWESLAFQPYFTSTASNVNYGWWSHDIGGHMGGTEDGEQFARWVQFGTFSPILRLHSTKNQFHDRRPWGYDEEVFKVTRDAMQLRHALIPYLYSMAWRFHTQSVPPVLPMYYDFPEEKAAYACPDQYMYGDKLLVAPFISPKEDQTQLSRKVVWLPRGGWYGFFDGVYYPEGWYAIYGKLSEIPVFARAGAIVPMGKKTGWGGIDNPGALDVFVFPGANGTFELYEDDGDSNYYLNGKHATTRFSQEWDDKKLVFRVLPAEGDVSQVPSQRGYDLHFRGICEPKTVVITLNGKKVDADHIYNPAMHTLTLETLKITPADSLEIAVVGAKDGLAYQEDPRKHLLQKMIKAMRMATRAKTEMLDALEELMQEPEKFARYRVEVGEQHLRALLETCLGAGMERFANHGGDIIVVWNNDASEKVTRTLNAYVAGRWIHWFNLTMTHGTAETTEVYQPEKDFTNERPWDLRLNLAGILTETQAGEKKV